MSHCTGAPADHAALDYVEGTLAEAEAERFEEHYFDCEVCLAQVQTLQAAGAGLARQVAKPAAPTRPEKVLSWPARAAVGATAAILVIGVIAYKTMSSGPEPPAPAQSAAPAPPAPAAVTKAAQPARSQPAAGREAADFADLALPVFAAANLRGENGDEHFQAGMEAFGKGDCASALPDLAQVESSSRYTLAARFYSGACQMHEGKLGAAEETLKQVAGAGDSPQQESALYYLAQIALERNNASAAHRLLVQTIALKGDLERRASAEDGKVRALLASGSSAAAAPATK